MSGIAWSVHLLTASGSVCGLLALRDTARGDFAAAMAWMAAAVAIDALDGPLARWLRVDRRIPWIDGALLDNLVDYLNYVVVPAFLILEAQTLPAAWAVPAAAGICVVSAFQFSHIDAKTAEHHFRGFPSYWNVLAFYLLVLRPDPWIALGFVTLLGAMAFVPIRCVYPTRTRALRPLTLTLTLLWGASVIAILRAYPESPRGWAVASLAYPLYYLVLSLAFSSRSLREAIRRRPTTRS